MGVAQVFHKSFWVQLSPGINPHKNLSRPRHKSNSIQQSSETLGDFFIHSKTAQEHQSVNMAGPTDAELMKICQDAFDEAFEILYSDEDWKEEKKNDKGDLVVSRKTKTGKKIYRVTAVIDIDTKKLANKLADTSDLTNWNKTLVKHELIKKLGDGVELTYQVTGGQGPVSSRDFVLVFKSVWKGDTFVQAGRSVDIPDAPTTKGAVRAENGPTGTVVKPLPDGKTEFRWLMDCEYKGMIPTGILNMVMPTVQLDFVACVRDLAKTL